MQPNLQFWATVVYVAASLIVLFTFLFIAYRLARKLIKFLFGSNSVFGNDARIKLITLGASALLFSEVLPALFIALVGIFSSLFLDTPGALLDNWRSAIGFCEGNEPLFQCLAALGVGFVKAFNLALNRVFERIVNIPVHRTLMLLATWALISLIVSQAQRLEEESPDRLKIKSWFRAGYANSGSPAFANVVFFLILAVGAYMSTAAIAAIPGLQEKSAVFQEVGPEKLQSQLEESLSAFDKYPTEVGTKDPLDPVREYLSKTKADQSQSATDTPETSSAPVVGSPNPNSNTNQSQTPPASGSPHDAGAQAAASPPNQNSNANVNTNPNTSPQQPNEQSGQQPVITPPSESSLRALGFIVNDWDGNRKGLLQKYKTLLDSVKTQQKSAKNLAVQSYEVGNLDRKGNKERVQYFLALGDWFNQRSTVADQDLNNCLKSIQNVDISLQRWVADTVPLRTGTSTELLFVTSEGTNRVIYQANAACPEAILLPQEQPRRPQLGESSYLGPFGIVASWLLRTESLPLALITGLVGFGLLGSACSTFVRERVKKQQKEEEIAGSENAAAKRQELASVSQPDGRLVHDLTGVIIRGLLAAVVVFLAVEGGLAIFASGGSEPNPYVLLLTCLIGAVFSERVWTWAEKQLTDKLGGKKTKEEDEAESQAKKERENPICKYKRKDEKGTPDEDQDAAEDRDRAVILDEEGNVIPLEDSHREGADEIDAETEDGEPRNRSTP